MPVQSIDAIADGYEGTPYTHLKLTRYYGQYLPRYYRWIKSTLGSDVAFSFDDMADESHRAQVTAAALSMIALCVEQPAFRREFMRNAAKIQKLCSIMEHAEKQAKGLTPAPATYIDEQGVIQLTATPAAPLAYDAGYAAGAKEETNHQDNPYARGTKRWKLWRAGLRDKQEEGASSAMIPKPAP